MSTVVTRACQTCGVAVGAPTLLAAHLTTWHRGLDRTARFWLLVDRTGGDGACWPFLGTTDRDGYGIARHPAFTTLRAHRIAYQLVHGPVDPRLEMRHGCDTPSCCNPGHLTPGTRAENARDMVLRGRSAKGDRNAGRLHPERVPRGTRNGWSKLTPTQVGAIRRLLDAGHTKADVARTHGVSRFAIYSIAVGRTWSHVGARA